MSGRQAQKGDTGRSGSVNTTTGGQNRPGREAVHSLRICDLSLTSRAQDPLWLGFVFDTGDSPHVTG